MIAAANQDCDSNDHTLQTFVERLGVHAAAHPEIVVDALVDNGYYQLVLVQARAGRVSSTYVEERPENATAPVDLPHGELVGVELVRDRDELCELLCEIDPDLEVPDEGEVDLPRVYDSEQQLRSVIARVAAAIDDGGGRFIAEVDGGSFLVEVAPRRGVVTRLVVATAPDLVERLLAREYTPAPPAGRDPAQRYATALYLPADLVAFVQGEARRADRSLSYVVQYAFKLARGLIAASSRDELSGAVSPVTGGEQRKQTIYLSGTMLDTIEAEARRLDVSASWIVRVAIELARNDIVSLPRA